MKVIARGDMRYQVVRNGIRRWIVWELQPPFEVPNGHGREFEEAARIVEDAGLFYVETPKWGTDGIDDWERQSRGWLTKDGAVHSVTHPKKALAS